MANDNPYRQHSDVRNAPQAPAVSPPEASSQTITAAPAQPVATVPAADPQASPPPVAHQDLERLAKAAKSFRGGASWFFIIAGLSMVNVVLAAVGSERVFVAGLVVNMFFQGIAIGLEAPIIGIIFSLVTSALFIMLGVFAYRRATWAFVTGLVLYLLDAMLALVVGLVERDFPPLVMALLIHVFALAGMGKAIVSLRDLRALERQRPA